MDSVDLTVLTDDELHFAFDELIASLSVAEGDERRAVHLALMDLVAEFGRRADEWIAERVGDTVRA